MSVLKAGSRLKSQVDATELVVIKAPAGDVTVLVGGHPAVEVGTDIDGSLELDPAQNEGALLGKRYVRAADDIELLVTKGGQGTLSVDGEALVLKESKPLPSSD